MTDRALIAQLDGYGLTTAEIHYYRPDHPPLLQLFVWQDYDLWCCSIFWPCGAARSKPRSTRFASRTMR